MEPRDLSPHQIREEIRNRVAELTEREPSEISDTALFVEELDVDSLMAIELMVALDKEFSIDIPDEEFRQIRNVNEAVDAVLRHMNNGGGTGP